MKKNCGYCNHNINYKIINNTKVFLEDRHFLLCSECKNKNILISKTKAFNKYFLKNSDILNLKYMYIPNATNSKMYLLDDIINSSINKHGSIDNINKKQNNKNKNKLQIKNKKENKRKQRKKELINEFMINKLSYNNVGDAYSYINYGKPSLREVINNELKRLTEEQDRRIKLADKLNEYNLPFDENNKYCREYIYNIGWRNFYETIRAIEMDIFINNNKDNKEIIIDNKTKISKII